MVLGEIIRTSRKQKGLTQEELAKRLGVWRSSIQSWEKGNQIPNGDILIKIAAILDISEKLFPKDDLKKTLRKEQTRMTNEYQRLETIKQILVESKAPQKAIKEINKLMEEINSQLENFVASFGETTQQGYKDIMLDAEIVGENKSEDKLKKLEDRVSNLEQIILGKFASDCSK